MKHPRTLLSTIYKVPLRRFSSFCLLLVSVFAAVPLFFAQGAALQTRSVLATRSDLTARVVPGEILVKFRPNAQAAARITGTRTHLATVDALAKNYGVTRFQALSQIKHSSLDGVYSVRFPETQDVQEVARAFAKDPNVEYAEPNAILHALFTPDDPQFSNQWNFDLLNIPEAWERDTAAPLYGGDSSVVVAVIDTGVAYETTGSFAQAPDLANTAFTAGFDYVHNDAHPNDDNGHGTFVAGVIAESTNNGVAAAGIAFNSTIMPIKSLDGQGAGTVTQVAQGIDFARANGADVINLSLGAVSDDGSNTLRTAVDAALAQNILVIAATGNDGQEGLLYPAAFEDVIAVGAVDQDQSIASYSNFGVNTDLVAPGGDGTNFILQQTFSNLDANDLPLDYTTFGIVGYQGTSMAAPHVAAAAALLLAAGVSSSDIEARLIDSAADLGDAGYDTTFGHGLIDVNAAFGSQATVDTSPPSNESISAFTDSSEDDELENDERGRDRTPYFTWDAASDSSGIVGYFVYFGTDDDADPETDGELQLETTYTPSRLSESDEEVTYVLKVKAKDGAGNVASDSEEFAYILDTHVSGPSNVRSSSTTSGLEVRWDSVSGEHVDHYNVWRSSSGSGDFTKVDEVSGTTYTMKNLSDRARYYFHITTVDDLDNESSRSGGAHKATFYKQDYIVVGSGPGATPLVRVFKPNGTLVTEFLAYDASFRGGVNVATGDVDKDGRTEIITGTGPGGAPHVRVFDSRGNPEGAGFMAYAANVKNGVYVAAGDLNGDGRDEIITGTGPGSGPHVRTFTASGVPTVNSGFFAYGMNVRNGVFVAVGDLNNDGKDEIVTGTGVGSGAHVRVWDKNGRATFTSGFFAYDTSFRGGVRVGVGDVNGDGSQDIITGAGVGGAPSVRVFNKFGSSLVSPFTAFASTFRGGVFVAGGDTNQDGKANIIVAVGSAGAPLVKVYSSTGSAVESQFNALSASFTGGMNIATGKF